jgi:hypothetical protein
MPRSIVAGGAGVKGVAQKSSRVAWILTMNSNRPVLKIPGAEKDC